MTEKKNEMEKMELVPDIIARHDGKAVVELSVKGSDMISKVRVETDEKFRETAGIHVQYGAMFMRELDGSATPAWDVKDYKAAFADKGEGLEKKVSEMLRTIRRANKVVLDSGDTAFAFTNQNQMVDFVEQTLRGRLTHTENLPALRDAADMLIEMQSKGLTEQIVERAGYRLDTEKGLVDVYTLNGGQRFASEKDVCSYLYGDAMDRIIAAAEEAKKGAEAVADIETYAEYAKQLSGGNYVSYINRLGWTLEHTEE